MAGPGAKSPRRRTPVPDHLLECMFCQRLAIGLLMGADIVVDSASAAPAKDLLPLCRRCAEVLDVARASLAKPWSVVALESIHPEIVELFRRDQAEVRNGLNEGEAIRV